jgi:4-hydroxy-3-polyprenylbenzoate decarboxylase
MAAKVQSKPVLRRIIVGMTGASGAALAVRALEFLRDAGVETHLVISRSGEMTLAYETDVKPADVRALASVVHPVNDVGASISSGSFPHAGMLVVPCSIRTMSEIATGVTSTLLTRAADVALKERRRLVLAIRETPLHAGHLRNMANLSDLGAVIAPIVPAYYTRPETVDDIIDETVGRLLSYFDLDVPGFKRWGENVGPKAGHPKQKS